MCGIVGYTGPLVPDLLERMARAIAHRGPDDEGFHHARSVHLGMRRLSIIDLAGGRQPLSDERGTRWVVFNGEIYNYRELRQRLLDRGHRLATLSDTEVLVHLHEELGDRFLDGLSGMFGLALWDDTTGTLSLARDRLGEKPLYYWTSAGELFFASEIKSLLVVPGVRATLDREALPEYLAHQYVTGD
ncbi:MAG: DUF1933 domain-containing protein, partial [Candidatus Riflebacteria bacterium]|nr:DUF1933 domain-containing protein [Candidatus Riflebacteria bacterium]